ncbi:hypothetical protein SLEP1_g49703 [Rubroshorea leprosula]|uniref:Uncharacterized protein n=1 Tax=Rubroshorea leprosula TaxID=152421 RepID=A0AAV5LYG4_9ROSI|nr:hypothetical protein SLEP1_g49703 [Rubroshorea leprosula]
MGLQKTKILFKFLIVLAILISSSGQFGAAMRPLHGNNYQLLTKYVPNWESLSSKTQESNGGSPCGYTGGASGPCKMNNGMDFAGRVRRRSPPPPFPSVSKAAIDNIAAAFMKK